MCRTVYPSDKSLGLFSSTETGSCKNLSQVWDQIPKKKKEKKVSSISVETEYFQKQLDGKYTSVFVFKGSYHFTLIRLWIWGAGGTFIILISKTVLYCNDKRRSMSLLSFLSFFLSSHTVLIVVAFTLTHSLSGNDEQTGYRCRCICRRRCGCECRNVS